MPFEFWDWILIAAVAVHATTIAYLHSPRMKALMLSLPIPFTLATLSVGRRVDATNAMGLFVLLGFTYAVWLMHARWRWPIVPSIALAWGGYILVGGLLAVALRDTGDVTFWCVAAAAMGVGLLLHRRVPHREEPGHRSPLPVCVKLPIILVVVAVLVLLKRELKGFMTIAPMVGVIASYEARHSLWRMCRQIPVVILTMAPVMATVRCAHEPLGLGGALAVGWLVLLALLIPMTRGQWRRDAAAGVDEQPPSSAGSGGCSGRREGR